jgi:hypothetical protein
MTTGEYQPQPFVRDRFIHRVDRFRLQFAKHLQLRAFLRKVVTPLELVECTATRCGQQPRVGVIRDASGRPMDKRLLDRILQGVLG